MPESKREINLYITEQQHSQISAMRAVGINMSSIARLAIRKFGDTIIPQNEATPKAKRVLLYLEGADYSALERLATTHNTSLAVTLRSLISHYLSVNAEAIASLF